MKQPQTPDEAATVIAFRATPQLVQALDEAAAQEGLTRGGHRETCGLKRPAKERRARTMTNAVMMHRLMDLIEAATFEQDADGDFADCAFALLALGTGTNTRA
jgi:hypothetical protein